MKIKSLLLFMFGLIASFAVYAEPSVDLLFRSSNDPVAGNPKGNVTVVEFFDYQCSHCSNMAPVIAAIIRANPNVRVVFKEYPVRGTISEIATRAALAAKLQQKYYPFNHALLTTRMQLNESNIYDIAKSLGINLTKLKKDMYTNTIANQVNANYDLAKDLNLTGTPAFFIGKTNETNSDRVETALGEMSRTEMQNAINKAKS